MTSYPVERPLKRRPTHPGEIVEEILKEHLHMPVAEAARRMGVSRQALHHVMSGQARLTSDLALLFGTLVDMSPDLLVSMQAEHDIWESRQKLVNRLAQMETVQRAPD